MKFKIVSSLLGTLLILFIGIPLLRMLTAVSPADLAQAAGQKEVLGSISLTLRASLWSTLAALLCGVPLAFLLARETFFAKKLIEGLIDIPVILPHTAAGIALLMAWGRQSFFGRVTGVSILGTEAAISLAMFFVAVPFLINGAKEGFKAIDIRYEKTALSLGASRWQVFSTVSLPMARKSILSGSIMMWARGISEFGAVVILAYHPMTAPVLIFERFQNFGLQEALPVTVLLILISFLILFILRILEDRR